MLDALWGLRYFLIWGMPAAALVTCLCMVAASALDAARWGSAIPLQLPAWRLFAFVGAVSYFPAGLCAGVLAGLLRPRLHQHPGRHAAGLLAVCLAVVLLEWRLFSASSPDLTGGWFGLLFLIPLVPIPPLLWLLACQQRPGQAIDRV